MALVDVRGTWFRYDDAWVLRDVSLAVPEGMFLGIIGPNGSGKTTLLHLLDGLLTPARGTVLLEGRPLADMDRQAVARRIAVVPQDSDAAFPFTVEETVLLGRHPHLGRLRFEGKQDREIAEEAMARTGILPLRRRLLSELSGGERQRVLISRALAQEPRILLLDEPTAHLDIRRQGEFFHVIGELNRVRGLTIVAVTHDINLACLYCDHVLLLKEGRVQRMGPPADVVTTEAIRDAYEANVVVGIHPATGTPQVTLINGSLSAGGNRWKAGAAPQL